MGASRTHGSLIIPGCTRERHTKLDGSGISPQSPALALVLPHTDYLVYIYQN